MSNREEPHKQGENLRTLVFGGRKFRDHRMLERVLDDIHEKRGIAVLVHGAARGADSLAGEWAEAKGIPVESYPVTPQEWTKIGRAAGIRRNERMLRDGNLDLAVGFPGENGTKHMAGIAAASGLPTLRVSEEGRVSVPDGATRLPPRPTPEEKEEEAGAEAPVAAT